MAFNSARMVTRVFQPCLVTVSVGTLMPEIRNGTHLLASQYRHLGGPTEGRFQCAPAGAHLKRCLLVEIPRFRIGQQPKLREIIFVKLVFWSFCLFRFGFGQT